MIEITIVMGKKRIFRQSILYSLIRVVGNVDSLIRVVWNVDFFDWKLLNFSNRELIFGQAGVRGHLMRGCV